MQTFAVQSLGSVASDSASCGIGDDNIRSHQARGCYQTRPTSISTAQSAARAVKTECDKHRASIDAEM